MHLKSGTNIYLLARCNIYRVLNTNYCVPDENYFRKNVLIMLRVCKFWRGDKRRKHSLCRFKHNRYTLLLYLGLLIFRSISVEWKFSRFCFALSLYLPFSVLIVIVANNNLPWTTFSFVVSWSLWLESVSI